jgi:phosphoserine phosphatase
VGRVKAGRRGRLVLGLALSAVVWSCTQQQPKAEPPSPWRLTGPAGGNRPLTDLDITHDGAIDATDGRAFEALAARAKERLDASGLDASVQAGYYTGPPAGEPSVFSLITAGGDVSAVPQARLRELYIEAHWLGLQARLAAAQQAPARGVFGGLLARNVPGYNSLEMKPAAVCLAASRLETSAYARAGLKPSALFDVDSTLWAGNGTDVFLAALIAQKLPRPEANPPLQAFLETLPGADTKRIQGNDVLANAAMLYELATSPAIPEERRVSAKDAFYNTVGLLRGVRVADARRAADLAVHRGARGLPPWKTRVFAAADGCTMLKLVHALSAAGVEVYFLSATPDVMVEEAAGLFGLLPGHALGSALEVQAGRYTGRVRDNPYTSKASVARQWLASPPLLAFGDSSTSDFPMLLEASGAGFMMNPGPDFLARDRDEAGSRLVALRFETTLADLSTTQHGSAASKARSARVSGAP